MDVLTETKMPDICADAPQGPKHMGSIDVPTSPYHMQIPPRNIQMYRGEWGHTDVWGVQTYKGHPNVWGF